jgi:chemotaxis protein methyltransferase CheR
VLNRGGRDKAPGNDTAVRPPFDGTARTVKPLDAREFARFQRFIFEAAGITMSDQKMPLVSGRLMKRVVATGCASYGEYYDLVCGGRAPAETQMAVDLLTTNETHFFREPKHFEQLRQYISEHQKPGVPFRAWSAASSTGEEPYTIAMTLADSLSDTSPWEVIGSDISSRVLDAARAGHYSMERAHEIPPELLRRYCLKGVGNQAGTLLINRRLRERVSFLQINLAQPLPKMGPFDVIFLRNVMIYFDADMKRQVVSRLADRLKPQGWLFIGHSESLHGINDRLESVAPTVYRLPK